MLLSFHFFFSFFNFIQTQFYYLITFFLNHTWWNYFLIFFLSLIIYKRQNFFFFFFLSFFLYLSNLKLKYIPITLLVGYNNVHPLLFYITLILFFNTLYIECFFISKKLNIFFLSTFTLILGGLWGVGNSVWGFFWVNDQIEFILLLYICLQLIKLHIYCTKSIRLLISNFFFLLIFFLLILRWGLVFTRHNFINLKFFINFFKFFFFFFLSFNFFFIIFSYTVVKVYLYIIAYYISLQWNNIHKNYSVIYLIHVVLFIYLLCWLKNKTFNYTFFLNFIFIKFNTITHQNYLTSVYLFILKKKIIYTNYNLFSLYVYKLYNLKYIFINYIQSLFFFFLLKSNLRFILNKYTIKSSRRWT